MAYSYPIISCVFHQLMHFFHCSDCHYMISI